MIEFIGNLGMIVGIGIIVLVFVLAIKSVINFHNGDR